MGSVLNQPWFVYNALVRAVYALRDRRLDVADFWAAQARNGLGKGN